MKVLLLNQCFWPDVAATAQQLTDVARGLAERGHQVTVVTSRRGYDDPSLRFSRRERWHDIEIIRVRSIATGKTSRWRRALNFASFFGTCALRLLMVPRQDVVVALTSPPLVSWLASAFTRLKGGRLVFWVMDLNPDEAIAAGWLRAESVTAKILDKLLESSMRHAARIVVLDRFMKERVLQKKIAPERIEVISPWSQGIHFNQQGREEFRREHGLADKFVVMYAGNHSPCHPLDTLLAAGATLGRREEIAFCFVGGGSEMGKVKDFARARGLKNILCLSYQPPEKLAALLSAADMHVVVMGNEFPGVVHPCKVYNILAVGSPILYLGPTESHMGEIIGKLADPGRAMRAAHGQTELVTKFISDAADAFTLRRKHAGVETCIAPGAHRDLAASFSRATLLPKFINQVEALGPGRNISTAESAAAKLQSA